MMAPDRRSLWLVMPVVLAVAPHVVFLPGWVSLATGALLLWRLSPAGRRLKLSRAVLLLLVAGALAAVWLQFRTLLGPEAGISLLALMVAVKLLEADGRRDRAVVVLAGYVLVVAVLVHHQEMVVALWLLLSIIALTSALVFHHSGNTLPSRAAVELAGMLLGQSLPLALLCFVFFPRLPSPLAGLVQMPESLSGLSDTMEPGSISRLVPSTAVAFRVAFADGTDEAATWYWRGPVLSLFDGRTWRRAPDGSSSRLDAREEGSQREYTVTLEPGEQPCLLLSGLVTDPPLPRAQVSPALEWLNPRSPRERVRYTVRAWSGYRLDPALPEARRRLNLALPEGSNPQAQALGRSWAAEPVSPREIVARALDFFGRGDFRYTLSPPRLGENSVDALLFESKQGFCEHYAAAFTVLMRAAGLPARVVTGYQGGELNPMGKYRMVRQRDAHAWAEVWFDDSGWTPFDPTALVAPERLTQGLEGAAPEAERSLLAIRPYWQRRVQQAADFVGNSWNQWVLGYDFDQQRRFLRSLSPALATLQGMLWVLVAGAGVTLGGLALFLLRTAPQRPLSEAERLYRRFLTRLARAGVHREPAEGAADFSRRASHLLPDLGEGIEEISRLYILLRYGCATGEALHALRQALRHFRPGRQQMRRR